MAKIRKPGISNLIVCKGSNIEPLYFEKLKEVMEGNDDYPYAVTVYPDIDLDKNPKTDAVGLVNVAIERKRNLMNYGLFLISTVTQNTRRHLI